MKYLFLGICLTLNTLTTTAQNAGFFLDDWQEKNADIPASEFEPKPANDATVIISIAPDKKLKKVSKYIYGNNAVTWDAGLWKNQTAMKDLNNLNPHVLRWPGGSLSNNYFWNLSEDNPPEDIPANINPWYGQSPPDWPTSVDEYYDLLENTNSTGSICVNYGYARYGTSPDPVAQAAHMAAEWVRYDNGRSKFWEIGNEHFGSWESGYEIDITINQDGQPRFITGELYGQHCKVFIDSMRKAADDIGVEIKIGVVAYDEENSWNDLATYWNEQMMVEVGDLADFLVVHSYFTPYEENSTVSTILNSQRVPEQIMQVLKDDMAEAGKPMLPVALTEWNIFAEGSMQQVSYINGMLASLVLGECMKNDYGLAARWDLVNGWNGGDDHAMFSVGGEPGVDPYNPRPAFFYMYYHQKFFGDWMIESNVTGNNAVVAFASSFSSGETSVVVVNKSRSEEIIHIEPENFYPGTNYYYYTLTGGTDNGDFSRKVLINGIETDEQGGGPDNYESIEASASPTEGGIKITLPPLSVVYVMMDKEPPPFYLYAKVDTNSRLIQVNLSNEVMLTENPAGFEVTKNGITNVPLEAIEVNPLDSNIVLLWLREDILAEDEVTLSYSGAVVMDRDSALLTSFSDTLVDNLLSGSAPRVLAIKTTTNGNAIEINCNKKMEIQPSSYTHFTLSREGNPVQSIEIATLNVSEDSTTLILTPSETLFSEFDLSLSYNGTGITSIDDGILTPFTMTPVLNLAPGLPPEITSAKITKYGFEVIVKFSKTMQDLSSADFTLLVNQAPISITSIHNAQDSMIVTLDENIRFGDAVALNYTGTIALSTDRGILQEVINYTIENTLLQPTIFSIPGAIDAELFTINMGMELEATSDDGGGFHLRSVEPGNWVEFEIDVADSGYYSGWARVATINTGGKLLIQTPDGDDLNQDTVDIPYTNGWQTWKSAPAEIALNKGQQRLRVKSVSSNFNLNWLQFNYNRSLYANVLRAYTTEQGDTIAIDFDRQIKNPSPGEENSFVINVDGNTQPVVKTLLKNPADTTILLVLTNPIKMNDEQITVSYTPGNLTAADNRKIPGFEDLPVENAIVSSVQPSLGTENITIYPIPATDKIVVQSKKGQLESIEIISIAGKKVYEKKGVFTHENTTITVDFQPGIYIMRISNGKQMIYKKIIVIE